MKVLLRTSCFLALLLLTACSSTTVTYDLSFNTEAKDTKNELILASMRMIERRVSSLDEEYGFENSLKDVDVKRTKENVQLIVKLNEEEVAEELTIRLISPFSIEFMENVPMEEADIVVAETQGFKNIALSQEHVTWLTATKNEKNDEGIVSIEFTPEGIELKRELFKERPGGFIGIFVRKQPVYKLLVEGDDMDNENLLMKIPAVELGRVFADDVNVGLHVSFSPVE